MKQKTRWLYTLLLLLAGNQVYSQAPAIFNYQGVARNSVGNVINGRQITLRLSVHDGSATGPVVYQETRSVTTNPFGLFNVQVGSPGATAVSGTITGVPWAVGNKYIQVEIDPNGGNNLLSIGSAQIASVPYALFAQTAADFILPFNKTQADNGTLFKITNSGTATGSIAMEGLSNSTAANAIGISGTITSASPGGFSAGVRGINNGTGGLGIGVYGSQAGSGWGVYGFAPSGVGVNGASQTGTGLFGSAISGNGVNGSSTSGRGVFGQSTSGFGLYGSTTSGKALRTDGSIQFTGINEALNRILVGDATGTASWQDPSVIGIVSGSGTLNYVPKWTPNGNTLGNSQIFDNGTSVGVGLNTPNAAYKLEVAGLARINATSTQEGGELRFQEGSLFGTPNHWIVDNFQSFAGGNKFRIWNDVGGMNIQMLPNNKTAIGNMVFSEQPQSTLDVEGNLAVGSTYSGATAAPANGAIIEGNVGIGTNNPGTNKTQIVQANAAGTGLTVNATNAANTANAAVVTESNISSVGFGNAAISATRGTGSLANTFLYVNIPTAVTGIAAATNGFGVQGTSETGYGVTGLSTTGIAVHGINVTSGNAARFDNNATANTAPVVVVNDVSTAGSSFGVHSIVTSTTPGGFSSALRGQNNGTGGLGIGVYGSQNGSGWGVFGTTPGGVGVYGNTTTGYGVIGESGSGIGGNFRSATNVAGLFQSTDITNNTRGTVQSFNGSRQSFARAYYGQGSGYSGYYWTSRQVAELQSDSTVSLGVVSRYSDAIITASETGSGIYSLIFNNTGNGNAALAGVSTNANSHGLYTTTPSGGSGRAVFSNGPMQFTGIGEANNYILASDAAGNASWKDAASVGITTGSGTTNYIPKWTPNGTALGNSQLFDNGVSLGYGTTSPAGFSVLDMNRSFDMQVRFRNTTDNSEVWISAPSPTGGYTGGIGTGTNHDLPLFTQGLDRLTVKANGNVGIGTATTTGKLEVLQTSATEATINATNSNAANTGNTISAINTNAASSLISTSTGGGAAVFARKGAPLSGGISNPAAVYASSSQAGSVSLLGITTNGYAVAAAASGNGTVGVLGQTYTAGATALWGIGVAGSRALLTQGAVQMTGIGESNGYVLASDAAGNASWQDLITPDVHLSAGSLNPITIPTGVTTTINTWNSLDEGGGANYNPATGEYTIPVSGYYSVYVHLSWAAGAPSSGAVEVKSVIRRNGVTIGQGYSQQTTAGEVPDDSHAQVELKLNAGDKISFAANQNTTGSMDLQSGGVWCKFGIHLIHK